MIGSNVPPVSMPMPMIPLDAVVVILQVVAVSPARGSTATPLVVMGMFVPLRNAPAHPPMAPQQLYGITSPLRLLESGCVPLGILWEERLLTSSPSTRRRGMGSVSRCTHSALRTSAIEGLRR